MPENKLKKYFRLIEAWAWCPICEDMIALNIDKEEIIDGLQMGIYTKEYKHFNEFPDRAVFQLHSRTGTYQIWNVRSSLTITSFLLKRLFPHQVDDSSTPTPSLPDPYPRSIE